MESQQRTGQSFNEESRLRVGLVAPPWLAVPPGGYGGTEVVIDTLARGLGAAGHEVVLFTTGDSTCPVERRWVIEHSSGVDVGGPPIEVHHVLGAYEALRDVDLIHDHTAVGPLLSLGDSHLPVVATNHNPFSVPFASVYRATSERLDVVAISKDHASRAVGIRIAAVIHHGIETEEFPIGDGSGDYLLFLGRMSQQKGAHRAIHVARELGLPIIIAGKKQARSELEYFDERVRPLLGRDATYVGEIARGEKLKLLGGAVGLVNPIAWDEPFGMVMLEALACATPVLTFARGAAPEIVEDGVTGLLADDCAGLVKAASRLSSLDRRACRAAAETRFSAARMVADHLQLYRSALSRSGAVGG